MANPNDQFQTPAAEFSHQSSDGGFPLIAIAILESSIGYNRWRENIDD